MFVYVCIYIFIRTNIYVCLCVSLCMYVYVRVLVSCVDSSPLVRETCIQSQVASYQRLLKWYLIPPCLGLSNIRCVYVYIYIYKKNEKVDM